MAKKTLTWYVGINKTGSTSLETFLVKQKDWLEAKDISFFPKILFYQNFWGIYYNADYDKKKLDYLTSLFSYVMNESLTTSNIILIDEDLSLRNPFFEGALARYQSTFGTFHNKVEIVVERLKRLTKEFNVKLVLYVRRQDLFLESLYGHNIKTRHFFHLPFYRFKEIYGTDLLNWHALAQTVANQIGKENLSVRVYDRESLVKKDIIYDFFSVLGHSDITDDQLPQDQNLRLDASHFEKVRAFNQVELQLNPKYYFRSCPQQLCQHNKKKQYGFFTAQDRREFLSQFQESNEALSKEFCNGESSLNDTIDESSDVINQANETTLSEQDIKAYSEAFYMPSFFVS